jgi:hypothetical protein
MDEWIEYPESDNMPGGGESLFDLDMSKKIRWYTYVVGACSFTCALLLSWFTLNSDVFWWIAVGITIFCLVQVGSNYPHYGKKRWALTPIDKYLAATVGQETMHLSNHQTYRPDHELFARIIRERNLARQNNVWALVQTRTDLFNGRSYEVILGPIQRSRIN